jgi:hypothetical protein
LEDPRAAPKVRRFAAAGGPPTVFYDRRFNAFREKPGGGHILVKNGLWILPSSIDDEPVQLTRAIPYDSTTIDVTPSGVYFVTGDRRLLYYGFTTKAVTTVAELPKPVRAGIAVPPTKRRRLYPKRRSASGL